MSRTKKIGPAGKTVVPGIPEKIVDPKDLQLLQANEEIISNGQDGFRETGKALKAIRDQKQFKAAGFDDFESYCVKKWGYSLNYANRLVAAHDCYERLKKGLAETGEDLPKNEYQLRILAGVNEAEWVKTWKQVLAHAAGKPVIGEMVETVVNKSANKKSKTKAGKKTKTAKTAPAEAKKLAKIGKLVAKALDPKSKPTLDGLTEILEEIQKLVAEKVK